MLLKYLNDIKNKDTLEETLTWANVASIYKKGDSTNLANYRPISLLESFYKLIAALVKERIDAGLDDWITKRNMDLEKQNQHHKQSL